MQLQFCGGARTVTGSQHLLSVNGHQVLLECGLYQGRRSEANEKNHHFAYDPATLDAVLLSHAHIDHSGNLPSLVARGYRGRIYATSATVALCQLMLRDSAYLQERDIEWVNKIRRRRGEPLAEPLYSIEDAEEALRCFVGVQYDRSVQVAPGVQATFLDAGHILGSAGIVLEIERGGQKLRLGFSGDIGRPGMPVLRDPQPLPDVDALIMESTYGNRLHSPANDVAEALVLAIRETAAAGGRIIIPAFAVGRTQALVLRITQALRPGSHPRHPHFCRQSAGHQRHRGFPPASRVLRPGDLPAFPAEPTRSLRLRPAQLRAHGGGVQEAQRAEIPPHHHLGFWHG